jgi:predicted DNA-binding antitoxin AbrB/MazE fold protein
MVIKGRVEGGRLKVDEEIDLPDGTEVEMFIVDDDDDGLDDAEREELHKVLEQSEKDVKAGRLIDAAEVLKGLRER